MTKRKLKKLINEDLENLFHMNENAELAKKGLIFSHDKKKYIRRYRLVFATSFSCIALLVGSISWIVIQNNNSHKYDIVAKEANLFISERTNDYDRLPIFSLPKNNNNVYLNIYKGRKYDAENDKRNILYFYQYGNYKNEEMDSKLDFYIQDNHEIIYNITNNTIDQLTLNNNEELNNLFVTIFNKNESIGTYTLI